jgi:hypothetical protein
MHRKRYQYTVYNNGEKVHNKIHKRRAKISHKSLCRKSILFKILIKAATISTICRICAAILVEDQWNPQVSEKNVDIDEVYEDRGDQLHDTRHAHRNQGVNG